MHASPLTLRPPPPRPHAPTRTHAHTLTRAHAHTRTRAHAHTHTRTHAHMHTRTHTHACRCWRRVRMGSEQGQRARERPGPGGLQRNGPRHTHECVGARCTGQYRVRDTRARVAIPLVVANPLVAPAKLIVGSCFCGFGDHAISFAHAVRMHTRRVGAVGCSDEVLGVDCYGSTTPCMHRVARAAPCTHTP